MSLNRKGGIMRPCALLGDQAAIYREAGYAVLLEIPTMNARGIPGKIRIPFKSNLEAAAWASKVPWIVDPAALSGVAL